LLREEAAAGARALREEVQLTLKQMGEQLRAAVAELRLAVEGRLDVLRTENAAKLEQMRQTVDEKLQGTLEQRLGASFKMVNDSLTRVHESVGAGAGDRGRGSEARPQQRQGSRDLG
jgi:DNA recombination protein RmuC